MPRSNTYTPDRHTGKHMPVSGDVPAVLTAEVATDVWLMNLVINNPTGGAIDVTVQDGEGTALIPGTSLASKGYLTINSPVPMFGGISWQGSGAGLKAKGRYQAMTVVP